ncbi:MAG TPA: hypothetical protein VK599_12300 [Streptosporangiaceae bacterium]|nr:hypothetical protein [Streptosporangiaceae bacterium]
MTEDLIVPWSQVLPDDLVLLQGELMAHEGIRLTEKPWGDGTMRLFADVSHRLENGHVVTSEYKAGDLTAVRRALLAGPVPGIEKALEIAAECAMYDGDHHKMWTIDQMVRALTGCPMVTKSAVDYKGEPYAYEAQGESPEYEAFTLDDEGLYAWDEGIAP